MQGHKMSFKVLFFYEELSTISGCQLYLYQQDDKNTKNYIIKQGNRTTPPNHTLSQ